MILTRCNTGNLMVMATVSMYCFLYMPGLEEEDQETGKVERRRNMWLNARWRKHVQTIESNIGTSAPVKSAIQRMNTMAVRTK